MLASPSPSAIALPAGPPAEAAAIYAAVILVVVLGVALAAYLTRGSLTVGWYGMGARRDVDKHRENR